MIHRKAVYYGKLYFIIAGTHHHYGTGFGAGEFDIVDLCAYGSRTNGRADKDLDLDILLEYKGSAREDTVFNILHDTPIFLQGIVVDINPIKAECSGTIEEYLRRCCVIDKLV